MIEEIKGGVRLHLFIQPKASKNQIVGEYNNELKIKITSPPIEGRANEGIVEFLSDTFNVPKKNIAITKGETSRHKVVEVFGVDVRQAQKLLLAKN